MTPPLPAGRRRGGALAAMAAGAAIGTVVGQALDTSTGGAQPAFAGAIGAALGAALGRSTWIRVGIARDRGVHPALALAVLAARIVGCVLIGVAFVGSLTGASAGAVVMSRSLRIASFSAGVLLLVGTAVVEQRWTRRTGARSIPSAPSAGKTHGA
jgi:hypothetical protein